MNKTKKKKNGFTLTEVLVVIVIISLVVAIAVPSIIAANKRINERLLEGKKDLILIAAELYGEDNPHLFRNNEFFVTVGELVEKDYVKYDVKRNDTNCRDDNGCVINPVDKTSLNDTKILVRREAKSIIAIWDGEGSTSSQLLVDLVKNNLGCTLITESRPCLYKGSNPDNYLYYSGIMWRIMGVYVINGDEVVKMITDENISWNPTSS